MQDNSFTMDIRELEGDTSDSALSQMELEVPLASDVAMVPPRQAAEDAYYTAVIKHGIDGGESLINEYMAVKNDLEVTGTSESKSELMELLDTERNHHERQALNNIMSGDEYSPSDKRIILTEYLKNRRDTETLRESFEVKLFDGRPEDTVTELQEKQVDLSWYGQRQAVNEAIAVEANRVAAKGSLDLGGSMLGFLELMVPYLEGASVEKVRRETFGTTNGFWETMFDVVFSGSAIDDFRTAFERMPDGERLEAAKKGLTAIAELPGGDMKKMMLIQDLFESSDYAAWQEGLSNLVGLLDSAFVGSLAFKVAKLGARTALPTAKGVANIHPKTPLGTARLADPSTARLMESAAVIDSTGEIARAMGVTRADIIAVDALPKTIDNMVADGPANLVDSIEEIHKSASNLYEETLTNGMNVTAKAKKDAQDLINDELEAVEGVVLHPSRSAVINDGERYSGLAIYGKNAESGYNNLLAMHKDVKSLVAQGMDREDFVIMVKDPSTGRVVKKDSFPDIKGTEFFIGRKFNHVYDRSDAAVFGADAVHPWGAFRGGSYFLDIASRFDTHIANALLRAKDVGTAIETRLLDSVRAGLKGTGRAGKLRVFEALRRGSDEGKVFDIEELKVQGFTDNDIKLYYSYRKVSDVLWSFTNREYRKKLKADGFSNITTPDGSLSWFGKPIKTVEGVSTRYAFDPKVGEIRKLKKEEIKELYENGGYVAKVNKMFPDKNGHKGTQVIVDGTNTKFGKLPDNPLPYIDGYFQRTYKENYFVKMVPKVAVVDGVVYRGPTRERKPFAETIEAYSSKREAAEAVARLQAENPNKEYIWEIAKELDIDPMVQDYQIYERNLRTTRRRGKMVSNARKGTADIEDPIESLMRTVRSVSNHVAMTDVVESMKNSWKLSYGHLLKPNAKTDFPVTIKDIDRSLAKGDEYGKAVAIKELIDTVNNTPAYTDKLWQGLMLNMGEFLENKGLGVIGDAVREAGKVSPIATVRKLPSHLYIALRPLRQILVQSGQLMQYTYLEPKYVLSGQAAREMTAMMFAAVSRGRSWEKAGMDRAAKVFGGTREEFDEIVTTYFDKSGLPYSVDANWFVEGIVNNVHESVLKSPLRRAGSSVANVTYRKPVAIGKAVGFDVGEFTNLTGSWLLAKRRWQRANPELAGKWAEKQHADVIAADARKISYAMTQPGTLGYQKGLLSIPLQFMAVPHKAILSMSANRYWSKADKGKMFLANLTLFGGYGIGLNSLMQTIQEHVGTELPPDALQVVKGGLVDLAFNKALALTDSEGEDPTKVLFAKSFSPVADGIFPGGDVFTAALDGNFAKAVMGPTYGLLELQEGRVWRAIRDAGTLLQRPDLSVPEKAFNFLQNGAKIASGYSDFTKFMFMRKHDEIMSARGQLLGINPTSAETFATLFGFQIAEEDNAFALLRKFGDKRKELEDDANKMYDSAKRIYQSYGDLSREEARKAVLDHFAILAIYDDEELAQLTQVFQRRIRQDERNLDDSLMTYIANAKAIGGEAEQDILNAINGTTMDENIKQKYLDIFRTEGFLQ